MSIRRGHLGLRRLRLWTFACLATANLWLNKAMDTIITNVMSILKEEIVLLLQVLNWALTLYLWVMIGYAFLFMIVDHRATQKSGFYKLVWLVVLAVNIAAWWWLHSWWSP